MIECRLWSKPFGSESLRSTDSAEDLERASPKLLVEGSRGKLEYEPPGLTKWFHAGGGKRVRETKWEDKAMANEISVERAAFLAQDYSRGFIKYCQLKGEVIKRGYFQSKVEIEDHHRQQDGFIHAGLMATMADHTAGYAAFSTVSEGFRILTIEFKINFLKPAFGDSLVCQSKVIREGNQIIISESELFDVRGRKKTLVGKALVTLMAVDKEKLLPIPQR